MRPVLHARRHRVRRATAIDTGDELLASPLPVQTAELTQSSNDIQT